MGGAVRPMLILLCIILVLAIALVCAFVIRDVRSRPIEALEVAARYRDLSETILQSIRQEDCNLSDLLPLLTDWTRLDTEIRRADREVGRQVVTVFLVDGFAFESIRREIAEHITAAARRHGPAGGAAVQLS